MLYPVWLDRSQEGSFWGYIIMELNMEGIARMEELKTLFTMQAPYEFYKEYYWNGGTSEQILHSDAPMLQDTVEKHIEGIDGVLCLRVSLVHSWHHYVILALLCLFGLVFSLLVTLVVMAYVSMHHDKHVFETLSFTDALTGTLNRRKFRKMLQAECRTEKPFLLCYIDFDRFKEINDVYGHDMGDLLLQAAARRLKECLDEGDLLFRLGGDEFVVFIRDPGSENIREARVHHLHKVMRQPFRFHAVELHIDISTGYVMYPQDAADSEELLRMADRRMYEQKQRHKNKRMPGYTDDE
jgi:diguanylate cyclase (GGDEF)-like protein